MTNGIARSLKGQKNGRSWQSLVPYSIEQLYRHIERQFIGGMTWQNMGKWHIDHIVPLKSFSFTNPADPEFQAAWALTNLRPLWASDNIEKNGKRLYLI